MNLLLIQSLTGMPGSQGMFYFQFISKSGSFCEQGSGASLAGRSTEHGKFQLCNRVQARHPRSSVLREERAGHGSNLIESYCLDFKNFSFENASLAPPDHTWRPDRFGD